MLGRARHAMKIDSLAPAEAQEEMSPEAELPPVELAAVETIAVPMIASNL